MKRKLLSGALALAMLAGCAAPVPDTQKLPDADVEETRVAYVPLDDRPVNTDRVEYLAGSLGYELVMPDAEDYCTRLDEQPLGESGLKYGDRAALYEWVLEQEDSGCDRYILSLDQLLSGGLVNSRCFTGADVTLGDGKTMTETELIESLFAALSAPENEIWVVDTVMRLAPTVGYDGNTLEDYSTLREYAMLARPELSGGKLTIENIVKSYPLDAGGSVIDFDEDVTSVYFKARERKLELIDCALRATEGMDNVRFLIGVDDSAPSASIQTNELAWLRRAIDGRGSVLSGADEDGMLAVCKMYAELDCSGALPELRVRYFGGSENSAMSAYDHQTAAEVMAAHLDYLGLDSTDSDTADRLELIVLTMPADESKKSRYISDAIAALKENRKNGVATVLMDASRNKYGADFQARLVKSTELGFLMGYAGYYDLANASGIALANGVARWLCLAQGGPETQAQLDDFRRTLADSLIKDICYKNDVKIELDAYIRGELGGDPDNFCRSGTDPDVVLTKARQLLDESAAPVLDNLAHSSYLTDLDGGTAGFGSLSVKDLSFPWLRIFELHVFLEAH